MANNFSLVLESMRDSYLSAAHTVLFLLFFPRGKAITKARHSRKVEEYWRQLVPYNCYRREGRDCQIACVKKDGKKWGKFTHISYLSKIFFTVII